MPAKLTPQWPIGGKNSLENLLTSCLNCAIIQTGNKTGVKQSSPDKTIRRTIMATVNRGWLKRQVMQGRVMARCTGHYTDDYAFDAANKFGLTSEWKPVRIVDAGTEYSRYYVTLYERDFTTKSGAAYTDARDGIIRFLVHSNLSYDMKVDTK